MVHLVGISLFYVVGTQSTFYVECIHPQTFTCNADDASSLGNIKPRNPALITILKRTLIHIAS